MNTLGLLHLRSMNAVLDIGNSFVKGAIFENGKIIWQDKDKPREFLKRIKAKISECSEPPELLYSASGHVNEEMLDFFETHFNVNIFNHKTPVPFKIDYETPETLGLDRIALVAAADKLYREQNVFIIDAGTCITYDLITDKRVYIGGNISPGLDMRFKALNNYTANLPRLKFDTSRSYSLGKSTKEAILNGVIQGVVDEIDQNIERYKSDYKHLTIILTGGDLHYLSAQLKNSIFADSSFQLVGLNAILENLLND